MSEPRPTDYHALARQIRLTVIDSWRHYRSERAAEIEDAIAQAIAEAAREAVEAERGRIANTLPPSIVRKVKRYIVESVDYGELTGVYEALDHYERAIRAQQQDSGKVSDG